MERLECKRCGYSWVPRVDYKPKRCPGCSSKYWDKEKKCRDSMILQEKGSGN